MPTLPDTSEDELRNIFEELNTQTDRGAGIVGAAIVEEFLTIAIKERLILTKTIGERIFSVDRKGFASEFGSKIDLAFCIGLIKAEVHSDLRLIAKIRNRFAHNVKPLDFSESTIVEWCKTLQTRLGGEDQEPDPPRTRYVFACSLLSGMLSASAHASTLRVTAIRDNVNLRAEIEGIIDAALPDEPPTLPKKSS